MLEALPGQRMAINYGFEKLRFLSPVPANARVRGIFELKEVRQRGPNQIVQHHNVTVEIEGQDKPALVAEWMYLLIYA